MRRGLGGRSGVAAWKEGEKGKETERGKGGGGILPSLLLSRFGGGATKATLCDDETKSAAMRRREMKERRDSLRGVCVCGAFVCLACVCACGLRRGVGLGTLCAACVVAARRRMKNEEEGRERLKNVRCGRAVMSEFFFHAFFF